MKTEGIITTLTLTLKVFARISFAAVAFAFTGEALAQSPITLTFEKLEPGWTNDYGGLQWTNFSLLDGAHYNPPSGYKQAVVSPAHVVLNAYTHPAELTKSDGSFNLLSAYLTGAWNDRLQVQVAGFYNNTLLYSNTYVVNATKPTLVQFDYLGVNRVIFSSTGGVHHGFPGFGTHFAMDNMRISLPGETPTVSIQSPRAGARLTNAVLTASGKAVDNLPVAAVWCQLNHNDWTLATGTTVWTAPDLALIPGTNVLSAYAVDLDGNRSPTNTVSFLYVPSDLLRVQVVGPGTVTPNYGSQLLPIGKKVILTAQAAAGAQFVGWSGNRTTKQATLGFVMASNLAVTATFVDVRRPVNVLTFPVANRRYTNEVLQATGKAADNVGVATVWYQLNSNGWSEATTTNQWTNWTTGPLTLQLGTNLLQAVAEDAAHNLSLTHTVRFVKSATTLAWPGSLRWALPTRGEILSSATVGPDGVVYFGNNAKRLYALDGATGAKRWEIATRGSVDSAPSLGPDGTLYVGTGGGRLYALEAATGSEKWHVDTGEWISSSPSVSVDGTVYCGCANNVLIALDAVTGTRKWSFRTTHEVYSSPAIGVDGTIYFGAGTLVYALEGATGAKRWEFPADSYVWASPALGCDGTVYLGSEGGTFYALDGATGQAKWAFKAGDRTDSSPALGADGTVYFGCGNGKLFALDGATGAKKWVFATKTRRPLASSPAIGADGVVYIGSWDGNLYAVDGLAGQKRWQVFLGDMIDASPAIARDGTVFIGSWNGWFCAINSDSPGLMESSWPKFKGGPLSVGRLGRCPQ